MATTLRIAAIGVVLAVVWPGPACAGTSLQATLGVSVGVTDNVNSAPTDPVPGNPGRETDLISTITPGLILTLGSARAVQRVTYLFNAILYAKNTSSDTYSNNLSWNGFFIPSKRSTLSLSFLISEGRQSTFNNLNDSSTPNVQVQPPAILELLTISASQSFGYELTKRLRLVQQLGFGTTYLLGAGGAEATTQDVNGRVGLEWSIGRDVLGLDATLDYANFPEQSGPLIAAGGLVNQNGAITLQQQQITVTPLSRWRRDLTYFLSARAQLGAVVLFDPTQPSALLVQPAGGAGLNLFSSKATADLAYNHSVQPNLLLRANFVTDSATLRGIFLLGERSGFSLNLGLGYAYARQINPDASLGAIAHTVTADATVFYRPYRFLNFFLRYQLEYQHGDPADLAPIPAYYRNTLLFGLTAIYPTEVAAAVPNQPFGLRADGRDAPDISSSKSTPK
jgi:hypothetical protein